MKLSKVKVKEYQSVRDSNLFEIGDITCLVGKNEAGKTSILQALYKLNPIIANEADFDITDDYPRTDVEDYQYDVEQGERDHAIVIDTTFVLDDELEDINNDFGTKALKNNKLTLKKGYENSKKYWLEVNEEEAFKFTLKNATCSKDLKEQLKESKSFSDASEAIEEFEAKSEDEDLIKFIGKVNKDGFRLYIYTNYVKPFIPQFLYFDSYYQLAGQENIEALIKRMDDEELKASDYPMLGLLNLARIEVNQLLNPERTQELVNKIEGAGNHLSKKVLKYWSQNKHLQMKFDVRPGRDGDPEGMTSGTNLWARVYDNKRWVTTNLSSRSKGFVWFFSFLSWYSKIKKENQNVILLLDEPGLFLHAKAQSDLLKYFEEELKPFHQLIYSTHSPFMVDSTHFERVRIVQDISIDIDEALPKEEDGTKVINDFSQATDDSLFPLQGALGYEIHQTLFVGPNCLIVEGTSDLIYIQCISGILERNGKTGLSGDWTITPVGGSDKVSTFVALLGSQNHLNLATLIDFQKRDAQKIENLYKRKLLDKKKVLTFADFVDQDEADIEDLFDSGLYLKLVNAEFKGELSKALKLSDLDTTQSRILVRIENYLESNPMKGKSKFSHYRPARYFTENLKDFESEISAHTLDRFEKAFKKLNGLIK
ncbi:AAA family ATPase [uncultured Cyclobacterium sp.]|uniref:AAA family ATPase n=1 Tax=uncultured Cyclobacterium sp. TaxID=453820 RepID=UPI0030EE2ED5|tara:strand:+ start:57994 stop:59955 length:1962 start_codon:yes stop_codon:yes gene_type:complete